MFPVPMIDNLIARFTPHAITLRDESRAWALAITDRLDIIADALADDNTAYDRHRFDMNLTGAGDVRAIDIPVGAEWELEYIAAYPTASATALSFYRSSFPGGGNPPQPPVFVDAFGPGVVTRAYHVPMPNGTLYVISEAQPLLVHIVFRGRRRRSKRQNVSAGFRNPQPDRIDDAGEINNEARHVGTWHPSGLNIHGPNAR